MNQKTIGRRWYGLADALCEVGVETRAVKPHEIVFSEDGLLVEDGATQLAVDVLYRFYELFDPAEYPEIGINVL